MSDETIVLFGYMVPESMLASPDGCDAVIRQIATRKLSLNNAMQARPEKEWKPFRQEMTRLSALRRKVIVRREYLLNEATGRLYQLHKAFRAVVRDHVGKETYWQWMYEAEARIAAVRERGLADQTMEVGA